MAQVRGAGVLCLACLSGVLWAGPADEGRRTIGSARLEIRYWPEDQEKALEVKRHAEYALDTLTPYLGLHLKGRVLVEIVRSEDEFRQRVGTTVPTWTLGVSKHHRKHVILKPIGGEELRRLVVHELTHVALDGKLADSGAEPPRWLHEGLAQWMEGEMPATQKSILGEAALEGRLLKLKDLEAAFGGKREQVDVAYAQSYALVAFLVEAGPEGALGAFLEYFEDTGDEMLALRRAAGMDLGTLEQRWLQKIQTDYTSHALPVSVELLIYALFGTLFLVAVVVRLRMAREIRERMQAEEHFEGLISTVDFAATDGPEPETESDEEWKP